MALTPHSTLRLWILVALAELGGSASKGRTLDYIDQTFGGELTGEDWLSQPSKDEIKWRNRAAFERNRMKEERLISRESGHDNWQLTPDGWMAYQVLIGAGPLFSRDAWRFSPKSDADYRTHLLGRELVKHRSHETLLNDFAKFASAHVLDVASPHPVDMSLRTHDGTVWIVEAKVVRDDSPPTACREALSQLYDYRHFIYRGSLGVRLLALFDQPVGTGYVAFLNSCDVATIWRVEDAWRGCTRAAELGLPI